jgi:hypothetical protein
MSIALAILGFFTAMWRGLTMLAQSLYFRRAKEAGRTETELAIERKANRNIKTRHEVEDSLRTASPDDLERMLRGEVGRPD